MGRGQTLTDTGLLRLMSMSTNVLPGKRTGHGLSSYFEAQDRARGPSHPCVNRGDVVDISTISQRYLSRSSSESTTIVSSLGEDRRTGEDISSILVLGPEDGGGVERRVIFFTRAAFTSLSNSPLCNF
jgi:hypothetical protein